MYVPTYDDYQDMVTHFEMMGYGFPEPYPADHSRSWDEMMGAEVLDIPEDQEI